MRIPVFPNWYPYNDMLLDRRLMIGRFGVKTRSYNWNYRGPVLLYNSGRTAWHCVNIYGYERANRELHHGVIIGAGDLADVRYLDLTEEARMCINFNNLKITPKKYWQTLPHAAVTPLPFGYFFSGLKRFDRPIRFNWPSGPVRPIFIESTEYPQIHARLVATKAA